VVSKPIRLVGELTQVRRVVGLASRAPRREVAPLAFC
jgi:hypothetical protein